MSVRYLTQRPAGITQSAVFTVITLYRLDSLQALTTAEAR